MNGHNWYIDEAYRQQVNRDIVKEVNTYHLQAAARSGKPGEGDLIGRFSLWAASLGGAIRAVFSAHKPETRSLRSSSWRHENDGSRFMD